MSTLNVPAGAGSVIQMTYPDGSGRIFNAYYVTPASHIGRIVTGIVFISEPSLYASREHFSLAEGKTMVEQFGFASISFADKLAEQGYKVVVVKAQPCNVEDKTSSIDQMMNYSEQGARFLKHQDIQRIALFGYGYGADIVIKMAMEQRCQEFDCFIAMSPDGLIPILSDSTSSVPPLLVLAGDQTPYVQSHAFTALHEVYAKALATQHHHSHQPLLFKSRILPNQHKGFAFSHITDEDAATQAIAEVLDWLVMHLHRFRVAACTSDTNPWWPQGLNGPFCNIGLQKWQETRQTWITHTQPRPPRRPPISNELIFDGLSSVRRTFDLPQPMALGDLVEILVEIWEVQE